MAAILSTSFAVATTDWAATWQLASVTGVSIGHLCVAESELAQVTKVGPGTTVTVRRGVEGTSAAAHASGTPVAISVAGDVATGGSPVSPPAGPLRQATVTLPHAQILTLDTTRRTIVPTPGATRIIVPHSLLLQGHFVAAYTPVTQQDDAINIDYNGGTNAAILANIGVAAIDQRLKTFLAGTDNIALLPVPLQLLTAVSTKALEPYHDGGGSLYSFYTNRALTIDTYLTAPFAGGDAANTLRVSVLYSIYDVTTGVFV